MLYPNFDDLVALKEGRSQIRHPSRMLAKASVAGKHLSPFRGQGMEFDAVREYVPGDDVRNIDWRVTARTGSPHLKVFKVDRERNVLLCLDMSASMRFGTKNTFKSVQAAKVASLLGWQSIAQRDPVSALLFGDVQGGMHYYSPTRTQNSFCTLLKTLSQPIHEHYTLSYSAVVERIASLARSGSLIYFISDFLSLDADLQHSSHLTSLCRRSDVVFISINDRADRLLPQIGEIEAHAYAGGGKLTVDLSDPELRSSYEAVWRENRRILTELARRLKISLVELTTESEIPRDLKIGLEKLSRRRS